MSNIKNNWFFVSGIGLLIIFIIKFFSFLKILDYFPINDANDLALKLSELYLLSNYGFHSVIPHWYEGFTLFQIYPPGWYFFSLPLYWLTNNLQFTALVSLILMIGLGFVASYFIFKNESFSKKIIFFLLFFMNPIMIDYIFFIGRFPELFGWIAYLFIFYLVLKYRNKDLDKKGVAFLTFLVSIVILAHQYVAVLALFLLFCLFLTKSKREKLLIGLVMILSLVITSFYWIEFLRTLTNNPYAVSPTIYQKGTLLALSSVISFNTFVIFGWIFIFYFYQKDFIQSKRNKLFFYPMMVLSVLIITRIVTLIPFLKDVPPNSYNLFFISISLYMVFKTNFPNRLKKLIILGLLLVPILTGVLVFEIRPERSLEYSDQQMEIISFFSSIDGRYILIKENKISDQDGLIGIATAEFDLFTPMGLFSTQLPIELNDKFVNINDAIEKNDCLGIVNGFKELKVENIIAYEDSCDKLNLCLHLETKKEHSCLFNF